MRITYNTSVISPIRHPKKFESYMEETKAVKLYIAISGLSAHVTGAVVGFTEKPVIGVPCAIKTWWDRRTAFNGQHASWGTCSNSWN